MEYLTDADYEIAAQNGISHKYAYHRFYIMCWERERAITTPITHKKNLWSKYKTFSKVSEVTFYNRVREGMTPEEAASIPPLPLGNPKRGKGKIGLKDLEIAAANGISEQTAKARVYGYKWPVELAITIPVGKRRPMRKRRVLA